MKVFTGYSVTIQENKPFLDNMMAAAHPGLQPSDREYLGFCKTLTSTWYKEELSDTMHDTYKEMAKMWNTESPPSHIQKKYALTSVCGGYADRL